MGELKVAPTSFGQNRLWFLDRLYPHSSSYNVTQFHTFQGPVDLEVLRRAVGLIIERHEILRTTVRASDGVPVQVVNPPFECPVPLVDLSSREEDSRDREYRRIVDEELTRSFDLERGPLINLVLVRMGPRYHVLVVTVHHIAFDDWSMGVFSRELTVLYEDCKAGRASTLAPVALQYADYATAERARFDRQRIDPQLAYWRAKLAGLPLNTDLPIDRPRSDRSAMPGATRGFALQAGVARAMRELTRKSGTTLFISMYAAFAVLLSRYCGQRDIAVGTPVASRNRPDVVDMMGFCVNTLVLRIDLSDDPTFLELLARARDTSLGALANQDVPFDLLVEELRPGRDGGRQPLFQTMYLLNYASPDEADLSRGETVSSGAKFDLALTVTDAAPHVCGGFEYDTDLFDKETIARLAASFETLVASIVADPECRVSRLALLGTAERAEIVETWNATASSTPVPGVCRMIEDFAASHPDQPAVTFGPDTLGYGELVARAGALAGRLRQLGVQPQQRVGICMERMPDWIVAMLGTLRAGATMIVLDPKLPAERLAFMVGDAGIGIVLTQSAQVAKISAIGAALVSLDEALPGDTKAPEMPPDLPDASDPAYVVYTSGSTGRPKGVLVEHGGLANLALGQGRPWAVGPSARVLQFAPAGFDAVMSEVFSTLCLGGTLCLAPASDLMSGPPLARTLRELRITHVTLPPSALAATQPEGLSDLRVIISAGEPCEPSLARRWAQGRRLFNAYGPTEITVCATMHEFAGDAFSVPIGKPIANTQVYVLDLHGDPVPPGIAGEIHVGGAGVARGYLGLPELTAEKFIADPFAQRAGARLYKTGDFGRFDRAGRLHYLGRTDGQLKLRGYRIEPGEIEGVLRSHPHIRDALVLAQGSRTDAKLIAYVIAGDTPPLMIELRSFVAARLPDYMTPAAYVTLTEWPKTANGKIDRQALPRPDGAARGLETAYVAPETDIEATVAAVWRECLGVTQVGATDNFFDLGGHSLLMVRIHDRLKDKYQVLSSLVDLFKFPTVRLQAHMIETKLSRPADSGETQSMRADQRAARQNAARMRRRPRAGADSHV